jgi:TolB-like protein
MRVVCWFHAKSLISGRKPCWNILRKSSHARNFATVFGRLQVNSSDNPRFIQTIPRHGYRFIVSVDAAQRPESVAATAAPPSGRKMPWALASGLGLAVFAALLFAYNFGRLRTRIFAKTRSLEIHSIAVLPLENLSKDPGQDYFSDGITDALTTELAQIGSLRVISRTSSMHFKGTRETLPQIAHELNVDAVVEGTVARSENRVRVTAQLIEASSDRHLWARSYERDLKDVLELQDEVARDIAEEIRVKLKPEERTRLEQARPVNPEALEAYLKGHYYYKKLSTPAFKEAVNYYRQALTRDPDYAPAYVGLELPATKNLASGTPSRHKKLLHKPNQPSRRRSSWTTLRGKPMLRSATFTFCGTGTGRVPSESISAPWNSVLPRRTLGFNMPFISQPWVDTTRPSHK